MIPSQRSAAPRSEGDANAKLTGALQDRIGDYAVQSHCGEGQRQYGECAKEHGDETRTRVLRLTLDPAFEVPHIAEYLLVRIKGGDLLTDAVQHGKRLALRAH